MRHFSTTTRSMTRSMTRNIIYQSLNPIFLFKPNTQWSGLVCCQYFFFRSLTCNPVTYVLFFCCCVRRVLCRKITDVYIVCSFYQPRFFSRIHEPSWHLSTISHHFSHRNVCWQTWHEHHNTINRVFFHSTFIFFKQGIEKKEYVCVSMSLCVYNHNTILDIYVQ